MSNGVHGDVPEAYRAPLQITGRYLVPARPGNRGAEPWHLIALLGELLHHLEPRHVRRRMHVVAVSYEVLSKVLPVPRRAVTVPPWKSLQTTQMLHQNVVPQPPASVFTQPLLQRRRRAVERREDQPLVARYPRLLQTPVLVVDLVPVQLLLHRYADQFPADLVRPPVVRARERARVPPVEQTHLVPPVHAPVHQHVELSLHVAGYDDRDLAHVVGHIVPGLTQHVLVPHHQPRLLEHLRLLFAVQLLIE